MAKTTLNSATRAALPRKQGKETRPLNENGAVFLERRPAVSGEKKKLAENRKVLAASPDAYTNRYSKHRFVSEWEREDARTGQSLPGRARDPQPAGHFSGIQRGTNMCWPGRATPGQPAALLSSRTVQPVSYLFSPLAKKREACVTSHTERRPFVRCSPRIPRHTGND